MRQHSLAENQSRDGCWCNHEDISDAELRKYYMLHACIKRNICSMRDERRRLNSNQQKSIVSSMKQHAVDGWTLKPSSNNDRVLLLFSFSSPMKSFAWTRTWDFILLSYLLLIQSPHRKEEKKNLFFREGKQEEIQFRERARESV